MCLHLDSSARRSSCHMLQHRRCMFLQHHQKCLLHTPRPASAPFASAYFVHRDNHRNSPLFSLLTKKCFHVFRTYSARVTSCILKKPSYHLIRLHKLFQLRGKSSPSLMTMIHLSSVSNFYLLRHNHGNQFNPHICIGSWPVIT